MVIKRALFSKPAWAAKTIDSEKSDQSIFQQNVYEDILLERQREEAKRAARQKEKEECRRKSESRETKTDNGRPVKKQRVSETSTDWDEDEDEENSDQKHSESELGTEESAKNNEGSRKSSVDRAVTLVKPVLRSAPKGKSVAELSKRDSVLRDSHMPSAVDDEDEDDELVIYDSVPKPNPSTAETNSRSKPRPAPPPDSESESESESEDDEYLKELKRKAREEAKTKTLQSIATSGSANANASLHTIRLSTPDAPSDTSHDIPHDTVQLLIQTIIPNCPAIMIARRPSQTLESVHKYFCEHHHLSEKLRPKVFFTWNNQRLFNSTTTRSILEQIRRKYGHDKSNGKIMLEAVTDEIYTHRLRQKEESRRRAENPDPDFINNDPLTGPAQDNEWTNDPSSEQQQATAPPLHPHPPYPNTPASSTITPAPAPAPKSPGLVIKLTPEDASTLPPLQLRVHAHNTIDRIVRGYKSRMAIPATREVYLVFEGERLDGALSVADAAFEDGDSVDVRCK